MSTRENSRWERRTWPEIKRITEEVPEAGIHFQSKPHASEEDMMLPQEEVIPNLLFSFYY